MREKTERIEIRMPPKIIDIVDKYKEKNGISTRTAAILELIRNGWEASR